MSVTKHRRKNSAVQWNPPKLPTAQESFIDASPNVVSSTECTGLTPQPVIDENESIHYSELYAIHSIKPQGNIGKCNPNHDPGETASHQNA